MTSATPTSSPETIGNILSRLVKRLSLAGVADPGLVAEWVVAEYTGHPRLELTLHRSEGMSSDVHAHIEAAASRLIRREPMQYVLGYTDFMGSRIMTDRRALIPRPETECLVEQVLACKELWRATPSPWIADIGTGSGCIAIALAMRKPHARFIAIDSSEVALELARENGIRCGTDTRITWQKGDLLTSPAPASLDAIVSNPPYIAHDECRKLPEMIRNFEPSQALDGGPDGLSAISALVKQAPDKLKSPGWLFLEIGEEQGDRVIRLLEDSGFIETKLRNDLAGRSRIVIGRKP